MRDYAGLVQRLHYSAEGLKSCDECNGECNGPCIFAETADAIEELLAESADLNGQVKRSQEEIRKLDKELVAIRNQLPKRVERITTRKFKYCPNCGALIEVSEDD